jgi:D-tyrosyl-tRNA(Tyr) deacylase
VRVVLQRVAHARVSVGAKTVGAIGPGLCLLLGIGKDDGERAAELLAEKILKLRIFDDEQGKMNRSIVDCSGAILVVSQFTLYGDWRKGNRPSFSTAAPPELAERLYRYFVERLRAGGVSVATGEFQARMEVTLANDGPVTFVLESSA